MIQFADLTVQDIITRAITREAGVLLSAAVQALLAPHRSLSPAP